jgi:hypothetical protein
MKKKLALTAVAGLVATALTGASAVSAPGAAKMHSKRLVSTDIRSHSLGPKTFAGVAVDRHAGNVVGYDTFTGHFYPRQNRAIIWDTLSLKNGSISVVVQFKANATLNTGRITHGSGKYKGIDGTVTARTAPHNPDKSYVTLTYHF